MRAAGDCPDDARRVAEEVDRSKGLVDHAEVLHHSNNVVVRFGDHVLKVGRLEGSEIEQEVQLAQEGARLGAPVLGPSGDVVVVGDYLVSAWPYVEGHHHPDGGQVTEALSVFHTVMSSCTVELAHIATSLRKTAELAADRDALAAAGESDRALLASAPGQVAGAVDGAETVVVHGEPHDRNLLAPDQGVVLIDLEGAMRGPAEWDLGFRDPSEVEQFWPGADRAAGCPATGCQRTGVSSVLASRHRPPAER